MSQPQPNCPSCRERMEAGFVLDTGHGGSRKEAKWIEGQPEKSFWVGIKIEGKKQFPIQAFRCPRCGMLVNYALST